MAEYKKPARGPSPDGLAIQERAKFDEKLAAATAQLIAAKDAMPALEKAAAEACIAALVNPSSANAKAEEAATKALTDGQARVAKVENLIGYIKDARGKIVDEVIVTEHKRALNTVQRNLDKRDGLAADFTAKVTDFLQAFDVICAANDVAYQVKPTWPGNADNNLGLAPGSFRWKVAHEVWRIASELGVKWPEAARESLVSDHNLTLADRLKTETANVMERLRQRPIPGIAPAATENGSIGSPLASSTPSLDRMTQPEILNNSPRAESKGLTVSAQSIPLRRETLTV